MKAVVVDDIVLLTDPVFIIRLFGIIDSIVIVLLYLLPLLYLIVYYCVCIIIV